MTDFPPTRDAGLLRLGAFLPHAGRDYATRRNFDLGHHDNVSTLSPWIRHRAVTEQEVLRAVLSEHSGSAAEKFIQEVYWRTYWKGWLEMRPSVWAQYRADLHRRVDELQTQSGLRRTWEDACLGQTGIACFDTWAQELATTGYLHNHARMWFASIWIFTLRLPWELGADFFLRHLIDGDPASNTLSWRWVGGLQTRGKHYLARPDNIAEFTGGRFEPSASELASDAPPLDGPEAPPRMVAPTGDRLDTSIPTAFLLHDDDLSPDWLLGRGLAPLGTATLTVTDTVSPLSSAPMVSDFRKALTCDAVKRFADRLGPVTDGLRDPQAIAQWARDLGAEQIVTSFAPVGPNADLIRQIDGIPVRQILRPYDAEAWPYATAGFFKFKKQIPALLGTLKGLRAA